ncbi:hypothetical protein PRIPAC_79946 [Pristionchus pacificus]|uniref:Uncharacterized protein n=1 Tax=Pristionchus pacificus TaxID=54126 RepID=A0A2A6CMQ7_PRIPA|nr:hypothetical protein PRIPAC_79946 [Pristionchus pacificus]|eukprot:PDM79380.1 hypothetical protein PRIPAC_31959 [Pristionchus pacificus]
MISTEKRPSRQLPITLERGRFRDRYLAFNRLTALVFPAKYKTLWGPRAGVIVHFIQIVPPSIICVALGFTT